MPELPAPPPGRKPYTRIPIWDRPKFWEYVGLVLLIVGLTVYNLGGLWTWEFFGG